MRTDKEDIEFFEDFKGNIAGMMAETDEDDKYYALGGLLLLSLDEVVTELKKKEVGKTNETITEVLK